MPFKVVPNNEGEARVIAALAEGLADWADEAAAIVYQFAPGPSGRPDRRPYRDTIKATTTLDGKVIRGEDVRVTGYKGKKPAEAGLGGRRGESATLRAIVYTTNPLGHLIELGATAHRIRFPDQKRAGVPRQSGSIQHPGATRKPHFGPGVLASRSIAGDAIRRGASRVAK